MSDRLIPGDPVGANNRYKFLRCNRGLSIIVESFPSTGFDGSLEMLRILVGIQATTWFLAPAMRRLILPLAFLILVVAIGFLWQHRFERSPGFATLKLADLRPVMRASPGVEWLGPLTGPRLRLRVDPGHPRAVVARLDLPGIQAIDLLHLRFQIAATNLTPGKQDWQDGRCILEWHSPSGDVAWENNSLTSARHTVLGDIAEWVARPDHSPAIPVMRVENLGIGGDFELVVFEATVVRETRLWKIGRWIVMAAWLAWAVAWIGTGAGFIRSILAATTWLVMGLWFVVPGPWKLIHSIGSPFPIGAETTSHRQPVVDPRIVSSDPLSSSAAPLESVGEIPDQGDFTLRLKHYAANARPLLHILLLWGPTLWIACLVGRKPALSLALLLALAIEAAQVAFGYGFDWVDIFDLACDAAGIALALLVHWHLKRLAPMVAGS